VLAPWVPSFALKSYGGGPPSRRYVTAGARLRAKALRRVNRANVALHFNLYATRPHFLPTGWGGVFAQDVENGCLGGCFTQFFQQPFAFYDAWCGFDFFYEAGAFGGVFTHAILDDLIQLLQEPVIPLFGFVG
jgi:hypothetical protein